MSKQSVIKKRQNRGLKLFYAGVKERDGYECQIRVHYPEFCLKKSNIMNAHHIWREDKHHNICLDLDCGITLCRECHQAISFGDDVRQEFCHRIAEKRDKAIYDRLFEQAQIRGPHLCWKNIDWLDMKIASLEAVAYEEKILG